MINFVNLPDPRPLSRSLIDAGFSHEIATAANELYQRRAEELKRRTETMLIAAWRKIETLPGASSSDLLTFAEVYLRCLEEWKEEIVQLLNQTAQARSIKILSRKSRSFNHEYLPLLEHFFEGNPFPTYQDKAFLAKKSNMQYRQIHVWFQNRRSRTKKETKSSRKELKPEDPTRPLGQNKLSEDVEGRVAKPLSQISKCSPFSPEMGNAVQTMQNSTLRCVFISLSPPHAFPSSYPPACTYDPFPCKGGTTSFGKPEWRRVSSSHLLPSASIGVDNLAEIFSRLNVRYGARTKGSRTARSCAATVAITVKPSRAPHPSLVVHKH